MTMASDLKAKNAHFFSLQKAWQGAYVQEEQLVYTESIRTCGKGR